MKKLRNVVIFLIINIVLIYLSNISYATTGKINSETVRMRKGPSTDAGISMLISIDKEVEVLGEEGDFYKVKYNNVTGYISKTLVDIENKEKTQTNQKPVEEDNNKVEEPNKEENTQKEQNEVTEKVFSKGEEITLKNALEIKIVPLIYSTNISTIEANTKIKILETMNLWCKIEKDEVSGWVRKSELTKEIEQNQDEESVETNTIPEEQTEEKPQEQPKKEPEESKKIETQKPVVEQKNKIGYVNVDTVNIRKETNTSCSILGQLSKNTEVEILEEASGWYKIKSKNLTGYIASKYVSDQKVADTTSRGTTENRTPVENINNQENKPIEESKQTTQVEKPAEQPVQNTSGNKGEQVVSKAKEYLGYKYVSGGASPSSGFDCSGFTLYIFKQFGVSLSRTSTAQASNGTAVDKNNLQLGDLIIFNNEANTKVGHVGIYIGENNFIHASNPSGGVKITSLSNSYYLKRYVGARRVI